MCHSLRSNITQKNVPYSALLKRALYHLKGLVLDISKELTLVENSIRDFLEFVFVRKYGSGWIDSIKISEDRKKRWLERQEVENKRLSGSALESRILYYADFYDLKNLIAKNWDGEVQQAFKDKKTVDIFLTELEKLRDPNAHRRDLLEYQKHLILGISGELRTRIMKFRGKKEDADDYFPVIEAASDSLGNNVANPKYAQMIVSSETVRVGDEIELSGYSTDPLGEELQYSIARIGSKNWSNKNSRTITFIQSDIGRCCDIQICVKTNRDYHAYTNFDDYVEFRYNVLPSE